MPGWSASQAASTLDPLAQPSAEPATPAPQGEERARLGFWLIVLLAAGIRLPLLVVTQGLDYWFYRGLGELSSLGFLPYRDYWLEYPPVFPFLAVAAYKLTLQFPPALSGDFNATYHVILGTITVAADVASVTLIGAIARRLLGEAEAERRMVVYAILFWPIVVAIGWYDSIPCALILLGLWLILRAQAGAAGAIAGLGFMTKIFPVILVPVAVKFVAGWRRQLLAILGALLTIALIAIPLLILSPTYLVASFRAFFARSSWETVWALLDGYYSYGRVAPLGVRFDPSTADYIAFRSRVPTLPLTLLFLALYAIFWLRPVARTPRNAVLFTGISTTAFLLYSKGYSPQFIIYVLPFVLMLLPWRRAVGYTVALSAFNFLEWPIFHEWFGQVNWVLTIAVVGRTILWFLLCWEWLAELWGWRNWVRELRFSPRVIRATVAMLLAASIPLSMLAWQTWYSGSYNGSLLRPAFDFVRRYDSAPEQRAAFIFSDHQLYQAFYPFFGHEADFALLRPSNDGDETIKHPRTTPDGRRQFLEQTASEHRVIFFVRRVDDWTSRDINDWLVQHTVLLASTRVNNTDLSVWQVNGPWPPRRP